MFLVSSVMLVLFFIDNTAGNPHPSFGSSHKSNKLGNCCVLLLFISMLTGFSMLTRFSMLTVMQIC